MDPRNEKRDLLLPPETQTMYDTAVLCGRYLKNRAASVSKAVRSTGAVASHLTSPRRSSSPGGRANHHTTTTPKPSRGQSATAYLSGVRGIAAVIVFIFHSTWAYSRIVEDGYGWHAEEGENLHILQLPFVRLVHAGHAMVGIFFLIGGYVNAMKPLRLMREHRQAELAPAVASSLLRRGVRLWLPALAATFTTALLTYAGVFEPARHNIDTLEGVFNWADFHPGRQDTLMGTLRDWRQQMIQLIDPWKQPFWTHYDPHLWTVPLEFRASLIVSLSLSAVACCRVGPRLAIMTLLTVFSLRFDRWEVVLFMTGAMLAELDLMRRDAAAKAAMPPPMADSLGIDDEDVEAKREDVPRRPPRAERRMIQGLGIMLLALAGMYLMSCPPAHPEETPGFMLVWEWLVPSWTGDGKRYVHGAGAVLFLVAVSSSATLQRPFLTSTAQYLGTISYSLYIVHGPVLHAVGYVVTPWMLARTGDETDRDWATAMVLSGAFNFAVTLCVADVFYRFVDVGSVRVAAAFQRMCSMGGY
ncbi:hypothetical protein LMH87_001564 [Akanthomyces muscarius]|uniref:Acyltransferase 3 domain-containing protein n=1 Tax=Akanthomyces muscarius TaxID=2231603 RepID=A0A9W8Q700_AKAMU|nr:hypothetical protein LMH87_001564 [Akanthomyces muscarius]KAJ4147011.1 hypothetical protein LMH87_001564 [Akanthomyces muscarius]